MARNVPPLPSLALDVLRTREGWSQKELAEASGIPANLISDYERGRKKLSRERLDSLVEVMGLQPAQAVGSALRFLQEGERRDAAASSPEVQYIEAVAAESGRLMSDFTRSLLTLLTTQGQALEARQQAKALWARLQRREPAQRKALVEKAAEFRTWALCELLCEESVQAAGDSADRALELADLALRVAERVPGEESWRQRLQGYAWAHVGNARRVKGDLLRAGEAWHRSMQLWSLVLDGDYGLLNQARVLGLGATILRFQGHFAEALDLMDRALSLDKGGEAKYLLFNKARLLEEMGDLDHAAVVLRNAASVIEPEGETRFLLTLKHGLARGLCALQRYEEAVKLLPEIEKLTRSVGNELDEIRVLWLKGRILAGSGRREESIRMLSAVRDGLTSRGIAYDSALVSLELALIYLEAGRFEEVRNLARQMAAIFQLQGIHREALAALMLFRNAAERKSATLSLVQEMISYLRRAQNNPGLKFEAP